MQALANCGWLNYFLIIDFFDEEAAGEFLRTFSENEATVWGLAVVVTEERIAEVTGLPTVGENFPVGRDVVSARAEFILPTDGPLEISKQGCKRMSLPYPYSEYAIFIIRYLTCEGRFSYLHSYHFKLLSHMRHGLVVNVLNFLINLLQNSAHKTQKGKGNSVTHHALIKILIERSLRDVSPLSWHEFAARKGLQPPEPPRALPAQPRRKKMRIESTST